ncbi:hypothetical protein M9Y10_036784 [Tritrichomonas musculus]|uniref:Uncharacterized protein n=1 Tax=Tritrichomonas musculus TaxID=1915356 RepID=A0ABR2GUL4_9EUKA
MQVNDRAVWKFGCNSADLRLEVCLLAEICWPLVRFHAIPVDVVPLVNAVKDARPRSERDLSVENFIIENLLKKIKKMRSPGFEPSLWTRQDHIATITTASLHIYSIIYKVL